VDRRGRNSSSVKPALQAPPMSPRQGARPSGFVVRTAETGLPVAPRTRTKEPNKIWVYERASGGAKPVSKKV
jgi:hypothetical protein